MVRRIVVIALLSCIFLVVHAQESWSLDRCIKYALEHSLSYRQAALSVNESEINQRMALQGRMPILDGNTSYNLSFGRRIDPTTNDFINSSFGNHGFSVMGGLTVFSGGRITQQIKQARLGKAAAALDIKQIENDLALEVSLSYIEILFAEENLGNAKKSLDLINSQLLQLDKLIAAGNRPRNTSQASDRGTRHACRARTGTGRSGPLQRRAGAPWRARTRHWCSRRRPCRLRSARCHGRTRPGRWRA